jgi:hypothetical protein
MKIKFQRSAQHDLDDLTGYLVQNAGRHIAGKQLTGTYEALETIAQYPRTSKLYAKLDAYESWLPGTRYIDF